MKTISFRLRKRRDKDLLEAVKVIDQGELSNIIREALRSQLSLSPAPAAPKEETPIVAKLQKWEFPKKA